MCAYALWIERGEKFVPTRDTVAAVEHDSPNAFYETLPAKYRVQPQHQPPCFTLDTSAQTSSNRKADHHRPFDQRIRQGRAPFY